MLQRAALMLEAAVLFFVVAAVSLALSLLVDPAHAAIARIVGFVFFLVAVVSLALDVMRRKPGQRRPDPHA